MSQSEPKGSPSAGRPQMPEGYDPENTQQVLLPWSYVEERMAAARNYWICTASAGGKPAATPVWGVWLDGKLYFDGSPQTRRGRNISANPRVTVHLESGDQVVILEGEAQILSGSPGRALGEQLSQGYTAKYGESGYSPAPEDWDNGGLFIFTPRKALGWSKFPEDLTRWKI